MKILITGATGFLGSHLTQRLIKNGFEVNCLVRKTYSKEKVKELEKLGAEISYGDVTNVETLNVLPTDIDVVYHLAALIDHTLSSYAPYHQTNVVGVKNLIDRMLDSGVQKFIFTSSIAAIGLVKTETGLVDEKAECKPITFYGKSKLEAEKLLCHYFEEFKFPVVTMRLPPIYGPGGKNGFLDTAKFIERKIYDNKPVFYVGKGDVLTSLCYVDNAVDALLLAMKTEYVGELFHVDDGKPYTSKEVLTTIYDVLGKKPPEIYVPKTILSIIAYANELINKTLRFRLGNLSREKLETLSTNLAFDISKARKYLGYNPKRDFETFVRKTIDWYIKNGLL